MFSFLDYKNIDVRKSQNLHDFGQKIEIHSSFLFKQGSTGKNVWWRFR